MNIFLLLAATVFYPLAPEVWKSGPLTDETLKIPSAEVVASTSRLEAQARLFRQLSSPTLRSRMALEFGRTGNPAAFRILIRLLQTEKNSFVRDNIFAALLQLKKAGCAVPGGGQLMSRYFHAASPAARCSAAELYLTNFPESDPALVIEAFKNETSVWVLNRLLSVLKNAAARISKSQIGNLYGNAPKHNIALRAFAAELLAMQDNPDGSALLLKAVKDPSPVIRMHIAQGLAANKTADTKLLETAAADSHPGVRLAAAQMVKPDPARESILKKMLSDPSPAVRAAAAASLGTAGSASAANILAEKIADPEIAVRRAVASALVQLKPSGEIHVKAIEQADSHPIARRQVLAFLVQTNDREREKTILRWIDESKDTLFLREAAAALGSLNCRNSGNALIRLAQSRDNQTRQAAAISIGQLKLPATYPALIRLGRDRDIKTAEAALLSMHQIGAPVFLPEFERTVGRLNEDGANCRAIACRAMAAFRLNPKVIPKLTKLITTSCIRVPMSPPMPDADHVRISALMLLLEHARKGDRAAKSAYEKNIAKLASEKSDSELLNESMNEFIRQLKEYSAGRKILPKTIESVEPAFTAAPADGKK